jgi:hypothetical protein
MADAQYAIPEAFRNPQSQPEQTPEAKPAAAFSLQPDAQLSTPETHPKPFHFIKEIENRLDSYRYTAIEIEESKRPWLKSMKSFIIAPKPLMAELIDKEAVIGGRLLQKADPTHDLRFWSEGHEWFFGWTDGKGVSIVDSAVHYQVTDTSIQKSYQGHLTPFTPGEETYFINAVQAYEHAVMHELYPFDEALIELMAKNEYDISDLSKKDDLDLAA